MVDDHPPKINGFLARLWESTPEGSWAYLWSLEGKQTRPVPIPAGVVAAEAWAAGRRDVYVGVSLSQGPLPPTQRVKADQAAGIVGFWADVDVACGAHAEARLPPLPSDALALVAEMPLAPTVIVESGHGLQVWWCFKEAW